MNRLPTAPYLYPVINIIGGPPGPERNGGLWRPIKWWMFLQESVPAYLTSALHGLDFNLNDATWAEWMAKPLPEWLAEWRERTEYPGDPKRKDTGYPFRSWLTRWPGWRITPGSRGTRPLQFSDSGGFALMSPNGLKRARRYGIDETAESVFRLQLQQGADVVASLDYPLPPGLTAAEIRDRQERSITNAVRLLELVRDSGQPVTPYLAVHGTTREEARWYMDELAARRKVTDLPHGLAIGSLVPRSDDHRTVVEIAWGVREGRRGWADQAPIHAFGIASHLMAFLTYLGVSTFDSTTYADVAQRAGWLGADLRPVRIGEVTEKHLDACGCPICRVIAGEGMRARMTEILQPQSEGPGSQAGYYHELFPGEYCTRSDLYGLLAVHNYHQLNREVKRIRTAQTAGDLPTYLAELVKQEQGQRARLLSDAMAWMAQAEREAGEEPRLQRAIDQVLGRGLVPVERQPRKPAERPTYVTDDFTIPDDYSPPADRDVLLLLACGKEKPYRAGRHQRQVLAAIGNNPRVHRVTVSGLYGPVPEELEDLPPVTGYDYLLQVGDDDQAAVVEKRLRAYLERHGGHYRYVIAYLVYPAYRAVAERVLRDTCGQLLPTRVRRGVLPKEQLEELRAKIPMGQVRFRQMRLW